MAHQENQTPVQGKLSSIDRATLTPLVRSALSNPAFEVIDWNYNRLYGGINDTGTAISGVFRFAGNGLDRGETRPWSLILKIIDPPAQRDPQRARREWLAYHSGLLDNLSRNLIAPRCFDAVEQPDGKLWLWLEEVTETVGSRWPLELYALAARHLGQFNAANLNRPLPDLPWLRSKDWLRSALANNAQAMGELSTLSDHARVSQMYSASVIAGLSQLWNERERFLAVLDRLPQTLCHHDTHRRNLFARRTGDGQEQTVVIDWDLVGQGAIGQEIVALVQITLIAFDVEQSQALHLEELVFNGYIAGLQDAGWRGDSQAVRFSYAATSALYHGLGFTRFSLDLLRSSDESNWAATERTLGRQREEIIELWAESFHALLNLADEARTLLPMFSV